MFSLRKILNRSIPSLLFAASFAGYAAEAPARFKVGEFNFTRPAKWEWVEVTSAMRKAQLKVVDEKTKGAGEVVFFAGNMGGVQANVERWFGQFQDGREKKTEEVAVGKHKVTYASIQGTYLSGMPGGPKTAMKDHALLGVIVTSPQGDIYVRLTGPVALVKGATPEFKKMIEDALK
ncbi:MAG: hypothetical protein FJ398_16080 [Verrucomicrobia bacterium]|nr:hypothetical protein [Verrucomicrobiota bacterium]